MRFFKKLYNFYRNIRSKNILGFNRLIYGSSFDVDKSVYVRKGFVATIEDAGNVRIGKNCFFNNCCSVNSICGIEIGDDCIFGENVHIYDHNHKYEDANVPINSQGFKEGKVKIGNNCWLGSNVVVLKGVTIGDHVVIGANCVVFKDVPDNQVVIQNQ